MTERTVTGAPGDLLRRTMGGFATGVAVVTTKVGDEPHGMTVNSLTSVSLDPPLILVCLTRGARTEVAIKARGAFVVNLLTKRQEALSNRFAQAGVEHFKDVPYQLNRHDLPVLPRGLGHLVCEVDTAHDGGDHAIVVGRVLECEAREGTPLLFYRGRYYGLTWRGRDADLPTYW